MAKPTLNSELRQKLSKAYREALPIEARREMTAHARATYQQQLERQVDPDGVLDPGERQRRASALRSARMTAASAKGVAARWGNRRAAENGAAA